MSSLPSVIPVTLDTGETVVFSEVTSVDRHREALVKAVGEVQEARDFVENITLLPKSLSDEVICSFYFSDRVSGLRFWLALDAQGFRQSSVTAKEAASLLGWSYSQCREALIDLEGYIDDRSELIATLGMGEFFGKSSMSRADLYMEKNPKNAPRSHKKGQGTGKKEGRSERKFPFPRAYALNALFEADMKHPYPRLAPRKRLHYHRFEEKVLKSNSELNKAIRKLDIAGASKTMPAKKRAEYWEVSTHTLRKGDKDTNVERKIVREPVELSEEDYRKLPNTRAELVERVRSRRQWFWRVYDKYGQERLACQTEISRDVDRMPINGSRTDTIYGPVELPAMKWPLYRMQIVGTRFTDHGGYTYPAEKGD